MFGGGLFGPVANDGLEVPVAELGGVGAEGGEFLVHLGGDVDGDVGGLRAGEVNLAHFVRLEAFGEEVREGEAVARGGENGGEGGFAGGAMVGMVDVLRVGPAHGRVLTDDDVRLE